MNRKVFFTAIAVMLLAFFAFSSGCGSDHDDPVSSPSQSDQNNSGGTPQTSGSFVGQEVTLGLDTDNDKKPDVLDFDGVQHLYVHTSGGETTGVLPFMVWIDELASQSSPDIITTQLSAGTDYSVEVTKNFADPLGGCIPDVEVYDPNGNLVSTDLTTYPDEQPASIVFTFTAAASGTYEIHVCNASGGDDGDNSCIVFVYKEMHNSAGENGYYARFVISDSTGTIKADADTTDIYQLRKNFLKENPYYMSEVYGESNAGSDTRNRNRTAPISGTEGYDQWKDILDTSVGIFTPSEEEDEQVEDSEVKSAFDIDVETDTTSISSMIDGIPYESDYTLGAGFLAITNFQAANNSAVEEFTLDPPTAKNGTTRFSYSFMNSKEDYEQKVGKNFSLSLSKNALGMSSSVQSTNNMRFSLTSTTLVIHYEELETFYRELPSVSRYKATEEAKQYAKDEGEDEFREEYGDYFVSGYQYGGMYDAYIAITTQTSEQLNSLKLELSAKLQNFNGVSGDTKFSEEMQETMNKYSAQINVDIRTAGAGNLLPTSIPVPNSSDISAMDNVVSEFVKFRNSLASTFTTATYVPIHVRLRRIRSLSGMNKYLGRDIPVPSKQATRIQKFNRELVYGRGYRNMLKSIPDSQINSEYTSSTSSLVDEFDDVANQVSNARNSFYTNEKYIVQYLPQLQTLNKKLKDLSDRYTFYHLLMEAQQKEPGLAGTDIESKPFGQNGGSTGYKSFAVSSAVTSDIAAGGNMVTKEENHGNAGYIDHEWLPVLETDNADKVFCYIKVTAPNPKDEERNVLNSPVVGKRRAEFQFKHGFGRDSQWKIEAKPVYMPGSLYPFIGLKD